VRRDFSKVLQNCLLTLEKICNIVGLGFLKASRRLYVEKVYLFSALLPRNGNKKQAFVLWAAHNTNACFFIAASRP
jgi:hypothetical protein